MVIRLQFEGPVDELAATLVVTAGERSDANQSQSLWVAVAILEVVKQCFGALGVSHGDSGCGQKLANTVGVVHLREGFQQAGGFFSAALPETDNAQHQGTLLVPGRLVQHFL